MEIEEIENGIKVNVPLITEDDIKIINNDFDGIVSKFSKMIIKDKDLAIAQHIIKIQQEEIEKLKENSIPKKKIEDKVKEVHRNISQLKDEYAIHQNDYIKNKLNSIENTLQELLED